MWDINDVKNNLKLNSDQELNPYHIKYPIKWTGIFENQEIEIIQLKEFSSIIQSYDFTKFPDKFEKSKKIIIAVINQHLSKKLE